MPQNPFFETPDQTFAQNPQPRCASLLLLDVSGSMAGQPIKELQLGLESYRDSLYADSLAKQRVEVAVMTFGGSVQLAAPFSTVDSFVVPTLEANSDTPMGQAIVEGLEHLKQQKDLYRQHGVGQFRPWVFLITDGAPTDKNTHYWAQAKQAIQDGVRAGSFIFRAVGVENADMGVLRELCSNPEPVKLKGLAFRELFDWLSNSQKIVSRAEINTTLMLPPPSGWIEITT